MTRGAFYRKGGGGSALQLNWQKIHVTSGQQTHFHAFQRNKNPNSHQICDLLSCWLRCCKGFCGLTIRESIHIRKVEKLRTLKGVPFLKRRTSDLRHVAKKCVDDHFPSELDRLVIVLPRSLHLPLGPNLHWVRYPVTLWWVLVGGTARRIVRVGNVF